MPPVTLAMLAIRPTAVAVCTAMTEGIINRFRTMSISRTAILTGHVVGSTIQTLISIALVIAVAIALGFRPTAGPDEWLAAIGLLALLTFALTWLAAAFGLVTKTPEAASNAPLPLQFLPLLGSAIVPAATMPAVMRAFAENQPFTPIIETLRGLLMGTSIGHSGVIAVAGVSLPSGMSAAEDLAWWCRRAVEAAGRRL